MQRSFGLGGFSDLVVAPERPGKFGLDQTRREAVDPNVVHPPGLRLHLGEHDDRRLGDRVAPDHIRGAVAPHRADIDNGSAAGAFDHQFSGKVRQEVQRLDVAVHDHVPCAFVDFLYRAKHGVGSGVVDQNIQPAEFFAGALDQSLEVGDAPHIGGHGYGPAADRLHRRNGFGHGFGLARRDHDMRSMLRQAQGDRAADASTPPGHNGHFVFERKIGNGHRGLPRANGPGSGRGKVYSGDSLGWLNTLSSSSQ